MKEKSTDKSTKKRPSKRCLPFSEESEEHTKKKPRFAFGVLWPEEGNNPTSRKRCLQPYLAEDVPFTQNELKAVRHSSMPSRISLHFQHKFKHAG